MKAPDLNNPNGRKEPFLVPEGYFEGFTAKMMGIVQNEAEALGQSMPKQNKVPFYKTQLYAKVKPYIYMAAMFGGLYFGIWVYKYQKSMIEKKAQVVALQNAAMSSDLYDMSPDEIDEYINDVCDYMMTDSRDIMAFVADDE